MRVDRAQDALRKLIDYLRKNLTADLLIAICQLGAGLISLWLSLEAIKISVEAQRITAMHATKQMIQRHNSLIQLTGRVCQPVVGELWSCYNNPRDCNSKSVNFDFNSAGKALDTIGFTGTDDPELVFLLAHLREALQPRDFVANSGSDKEILRSKAVELQNLLYSIDIRTMTNDQVMMTP